MRGVEARVDAVTIRVVLVGDQITHRGPLSGADDVVLAANSEDIPRTVLQAERVQADVVVLTSCFRGSKRDLCSRLQLLDPPPRTLVLAERGDEDALLEAIEAGVDGYVIGAVDEAHTLDAMRALPRGESVIPPTMLGSLLRRLIERRREATRAAEQLVRLTPREREVLALLVDGLDQEAISSVLFIAPDTTRTHVQRLLRKLGVHSRAEAIALIAQSGLADRLERMVERSVS
jgi:two-component system, NarL family, response regulator DevR